MDFQQTGVCKCFEGLKSVHSLPDGANTQLIRLISIIGKSVGAGLPPLLSTAVVEETQSEQQEGFAGLGYKACF